MSSGINWMYKVSNAYLSDPPVRFRVGISWASGAKDQLTVGWVEGLGAIRSAYADLPGLGYNRMVWLSAPLSSPAQIAELGARLQLDQFVKETGSAETPLPHGLNTNVTVRKFIEDCNFMCGQEIARHAGVHLDDKFIEVWKALAIAAYEWPRKRWGIAPKVTALRVRDCWGGRIVDKAEAIYVLSVAEAWGRAIDPEETKKAEINLASLLSGKAILKREAISPTSIQRVQSYIKEE